MPTMSAASTPSRNATINAWSTDPPYCNSVATYHLTYRISVEEWRRQRGRQPSDGFGCATNSCRSTLLEGCVAARWIGTYPSLATCLKTTKSEAGLARKIGLGCYDTPGAPSGLAAPCIPTLTTTAFCF